MRAILASVFWILTCGVTSSASAQVEITFLDVGQGDAVLIQSPDGHHALIDGGTNRDLASNSATRYPRRCHVTALLACPTMGCFTTSRTASIHNIKLRDVRQYQRGDAALQSTCEDSPDAAIRGTRILAPVR